MTKTQMQPKRSTKRKTLEGFASTSSGLNPPHNMIPRIPTDPPVEKEEKIVILTMSSVTTVIEEVITREIADLVSVDPDLPGVVIEIAQQGEDAILDHLVTIEAVIAGDVRIGIPDLLEDPMIILMITIENATIPQKKGGVTITEEDLREMIVVAGETVTILGQDQLTAVEAKTEEISIEMTPEKEGLEMINPPKKILLEAKKKKENLVKIMSKKSFKMMISQTSR
jgi:hypothetical protein